MTADKRKARRQFFKNEIRQKINIKNYTTQIAASTSIAAIEKLFVQAGARNIMSRYDDNGMTKAIAFILPVENRQLTFDLDAKIEPLYNLFIEEYIRPTERSYQICWEQAERTAWKLIHEWVHINLNMVMLEQGEFLELFFPKLHDGKETFFARLKAGNYKMLLPP